MLSKVKFVLATICSLITTFAVAQKVTFETAAPTIVAVGEDFRVEFNLDANPDSFTPPTFSGVSVLAGPSRSQGQSVSIINGKMTSSVSFTYTYVLQADKEGKIVIPPAKAVVDGKSYQTRSVTIQVVNEGGGGGSQSGSGSSGSNGSSHAGAQPTAQSRGKLAPDDILVRMIPSQTSVYKGEPIVLSIKLYTRVNLSGVNNIKFPAFNGFWTQQIEHNDKWSQENYNQKIYNVTTLRQYLLYPRKAGKLMIEQFDIDLTAQVREQNQGRSQDIFDQMFGGMDSYREIHKKVVAHSLSISVNELPSGAPADFSGAVGRFTMTGDLSADSYPANSAGTYRIKLSGTGNFPLITTPKVALPTSFELYNVKNDDAYQNTSSGSSGSISYEYPFIPRAEGDYTIEPVRFTYFDPSQRKYVTLLTSPTQVKITPDDGTGASTSGLVSGVNREDVKMLGQDIRYVKSDLPRFKTRSSLFMGSILYFGIAALVLALFVASLLFLQKQIRESRNQVLMRNRKAAKVAERRFKKAAADMGKDDKKEFYAETLRALWGYISDKLNIPGAQLNKENIREQMIRSGFSDEVSQQYLDLISECEFAQYAPAAAAEMQSIYDRSTKIVIRLESKKA